jgi:simple sugar transport system ATP-binding protein
MVPLLFLMIVIIVFGHYIPDFFSWTNFSISSRQLGELLFVTIGMTVVLLAGGVDLSVGSNYALGNFVALALINAYNAPVWLVIPCVLIVTGLVGLLNGIFIGFLRLRAFLTTLATLIVIRAIVDSLVISYGTAAAYSSIEVSGWDSIGDGTIAGIPFSFAAAIALALVLHVVISRTRYGWWVQAVGGSRRAAYNAGIPVRRTVCMTYVASGILAGAGSLFYAARLGSTGSDTGIGLEMIALTAAVLGGNKLGGGRGSIGLAIIGATIILVALNGLIRLGFQSGASNMILGIIMLVAVAIDVGWRHGWERLFGQPRISPGEASATSQATVSSRCGGADIAFDQSGNDPRGTLDGTIPKAAGEGAAKPILEVKNLGKEYHRTVVLSNVSLEIFASSIHAIVGENGAGKSTLTTIMAGVAAPTAGEILLDGKPITFASPAEAIRNGVVMVFQEMSLVPSMTVAQNIFLGEERLFNRLNQLYLASQQLLRSLGFGVSPIASVESLGAAQKQMVEIARAVRKRARIIIFDEPTASLSPEEVTHLFALFHTLKARGVAIVFIAHALEEVLSISDKITILRDGYHVVTGATANFNREKIIRGMVGRDLSNDLYNEKGTRRARPRGPEMLSAQNLNMGDTVKNSTFMIYAGQVTGIFGLIGSGRTETAKLVAGLLRRDLINGGSIKLAGREVNYKSASHAVRDGVVYVTEDRKFEGFFETMSVGENLQIALLSAGLSEGMIVHMSEARKLAAEWSKRLSIRATNADPKVIELSGGNQQKVVVARGLVQKPKLILFDEPTKGVDVGAIAEIHQLINKLADSGMAVVVISSYLPEIMVLSDRILVSHAGRIVEELSPNVATEEKVMQAAIR